MTGLQLVEDTENQNSPRTGGAPEPKQDISDEKIEIPETEEQHTVRNAAAQSACTGEWTILRSTWFRPTAVRTAFVDQY